MSVRDLTEVYKPDYSLKLEADGGFNVYTDDGKLMLKSVGLPFLPVANRAVAWGKPQIQTAEKGDVDVITYELPDNCLYNCSRVMLECHENYIEFYFKGTVKRKMYLHKWNLFAKGTEINAIDCIDFRSHINSPSAYEVHQTILGRRKLGTLGLDVTTEDSDLMFAPHPMLFIFRHLENHLIVAPMELVAGESLHVKMKKGSTRVEDYYVRIGENLYWLEEGEKLESPHFMIHLTKDEDVYGTLASYTDQLVKDRRISVKEESELEPWWLGPMWCSWGDQHMVLDSGTGGTAFTQELRKQAVDNINEEMVRKVVGVIEEHDLPIKTIVIDDRWYTWQGDMKVDTDKFPDLRGLVDELHGRGYKVMAWASLYQFEKESEVYRQHPEWFLIHHYDSNVYNSESNIIGLDYSNPEVAGPYLSELMERLLSDKPGCYSLDGIKFDWPFLLPHDYAYSDRDWVGKEKTIYNTQKLVYEAAKAAKRDSLIIGVSPHPFFQDTQDVIRTYDVSTFDPTIHLERARYIKALCPGMVPVMDEHVYYQNFFRYVKEATKFGPPMIFNLLRFNGDGHVYAEEDYRQLKVILDDYVDGTPRLKELQS